MRAFAALCTALVPLLLAGCGGTESDGDGDVDSWPDGDGSEDGGDADVDADVDADGDVDADADGDEDQVPESCDFGYDDIFEISLPPPPLPPPAFEDQPQPFIDEDTDWIAHAEPAPAGYYRLAPKAPGDPDLVMPDYVDTMPLFERGAAWTTPTRCYETPLGVMLLTEEEAFLLYRDIAELTTGVAMNTDPGVRSAVGIRGAYPGTFSWHGNRPDRFNDTMVLLWIDDDGAHHVREFPVHTDVGARNFGYHSSSSLRPNRRYRYVNGWHRGYNALHIDEYDYRVRDDTNHNGHWDSDRNGWLPPDGALDHDRTGGGHNIHTGEVDGPLGTAAVNGWSAGCQVIPGIANWTEFIFRAWTEMGDRVDYFLVDARDIAPDVWEACVPDGSHRCPFPIDELPFVATGDTDGWPISEFDLYNCASQDESGAEVVYVMTTDQSGTLTVSVDCEDPVDIDVHLLDGDDQDACLDRGHITFDYDLTPGRYFIVADTFVSGSALSGPFTLDVELR